MDFKKRFSNLTILATLTFVIVSCASIETQQKDSYQPRLLTDLHSERLIPYPVDMSDEFAYALMRGTRSMDGAPGENYWQQYARYSIQAEINPQTHVLTGSMNAVYFNNSPDQLGTLHLELAQNVHQEGVVRSRPQEVTGGINLHRILVDGIELTEGGFDDNTFYVDGTQLVLRPARRLATGDSIQVEIEWDFLIPMQGAGGRMGRDDDLYYIGYWYPHFSVYDDVYGWMTDDFRGNAEFYHGFADYELFVNMPADWVVMGTGNFVNPQETLSEIVYQRYMNSFLSDEITPVITAEEFGFAATAPTETGYHTWHFSSEKIRDVAFSATRRSYWDATRAAVGDLNGDGNIDYARINAFYRDGAPLWVNAAEYAQHSVTFLSQLADFPYPWPHMTTVEGANIIGGGMEYPMMTIIGSYNGLPAWRLYSVTAHEIAHMWMPMIVSTNERRYTWIDEGNTVFKTDYARKDFYPQMDLHGSTQAQYIAFALTGREGEIMRRSDFHYSQQAYGVASYPKPASILVALRGVLGEDVFWDAYHTFIREWAYKHPYPWDMFNTYERVSGMDLSWFWRSWYFETWMLNQVVHSVEVKDGDTVVTIRDYGDVPMPVLLRAEYADGTVIDKRVSHEVWLTGTRETTIILPGTGVQRVSIDPDRYFPDVERHSNTWPRITN